MKIFIHNSFVMRWIARYSLLGFLFFFPSVVFGCTPLVSSSGSSLFTYVLFVVYFSVICALVVMCTSFWRRKEQVYFKVLLGMLLGVVLFPLLVSAINYRRNVQEEKMWEQKRIEYQRSCDELKAHGKQCPIIIAYPMC